MADLGAVFAKLAGIRRTVEILLKQPEARSGRTRLSYSPDDARTHFERSTALVDELRLALPALYGDFPPLPLKPDDCGGIANLVGWYSRDQVLALARDLEHVFELRANSELSVPVAIASGPKRTVFISHGRAPDWREVQAFVDKDLELRTLELEQEASTGMTVTAKLAAVANECDTAVIVMTGDDSEADGTVRARENVIHEIGFFQGRLGSDRVCLLHEEGVNIPTNLAGIVYVPFPKGLIRAAFGVLQRELAAMYKRG